MYASNSLPVWLGPKVHSCPLAQLPHSCPLAGCPPGQCILCAYGRVHTDEQGLWLCVQVCVQVCVCVCVSVCVSALLRSHAPIPTTRTPSVLANMGEYQSHGSHPCWPTLTWVSTSLMVLTHVGQHLRGACSRDGCVE